MKKEALIEFYMNTFTLNRVEATEALSAQVLRVMTDALCGKDVAISALYYGISEEERAVA